MQAQALGRPWHATLTQLNESPARRPAADAEGAIGQQNTHTRRRAPLCGGIWFASFIAALFANTLFAADEAALPEVYRDTFDSADHWQPTDPKAWEIVETERGNVYRLARQSQYQPPHRSPHNISLLRNVTVGDFVLDVDVRSTTRDYAHRDVCLFFGYQDASHFYYVHLGKRTDDHANQIFIVNNAPRTKISTHTTPGTPWDNAWHHVRIVRHASDGTIEVYFDDMQQPVMTATDRTFAWGQVGLGSFDDTGDFDNFVLRGRVVEHQNAAGK